MEEIQSVLELVVQDLKQQPYYQILSACHPDTGEKMRVIYMAENGEAIVKNLSGDTLEQGKDYKMCDDDSGGINVDEQLNLDEIKIGNVEITEDEGFVLIADDGSRFAIGSTNTGTQQVTPLQK